MNPFHRLLAKVRKFHQDHAGVAAVEFAIILPVMLILYIGGNELSHALTVSRKVTHVSSSLADLVTQTKTISEGEMCDVLNAAASVITPYPVAKIRIKLTGVKIDAASVAKVAWGAAKNTTPLAKDTIVTSIPAGIKTASTSIVVGEVHYDYKPTFGYVFTGTLDIQDTFYFRPRRSDEVTGPTAGTFTCA